GRAHARGACPRAARGRDGRARARRGEAGRDGGAMSDTTPTDANDLERALRRVTLEAAQEPVPEIDWDRVESRLMRAITREDDARARASEPMSPMARVFTFAAAAGFIALGVGSMARTNATAPASEPVAIVVDAASLPASATNPSAHEMLSLHAG